MNRTSALGFAAVILLSDVTSVAAWQIGTPSQVSGLAHTFSFQGALVWNLGGATQLVIACDADDRLSVALTVPYVEPLYVAPAFEGAISISTGDHEVWASGFDGPTSYSGTDVTLDAYRRDGIVDLLRNLIGVDAQPEIKFDGLYGWKVVARPPVSMSDRSQSSRLEEVCPVLQREGLSLHPDPARLDLSLNDFLLDRWLYRDRRISINDCRLSGSASLLPGNAAGTEEAKWLDAARSFAVDHNLHVSVGGGEANFWASGPDDLGAPDLVAAFVKAAGGSLVESQGDRTGAPVRVRAPQPSNVQFDPATLDLRCAPEGGGPFPTPVILETATMAPELKAWGLKHCVKWHAVGEPVCSRVTVSGVVDKNQTLRLTHATLISPLQSP